MGFKPTFCRCASPELGICRLIGNDKVEDTTLVKRILRRSAFLKTGMHRQPRLSMHYALILTNYAS